MGVPFTYSGNVERGWVERSTKTGWWLEAKTLKLKGKWIYGDGVNLKDSVRGKIDKVVE